MQQPVIETNFSDLKLLQRGKVRDIYDLGEHLLMVATDRISAFDVVMPDPIPDKGRVLTQISLFWLQHFTDIVDNHLVSARIEDYPSACRQYGDILQDRSMLVRKTRPLPIECIVRGYLSGSGWKSYREAGHVCGISLLEGLLESSRLPEPLFTPSTKAEQGEHDQNIDFDTAAKLVGAARAEQVRSLSLALYNKGAAIAAQQGIIIADTKFEFGLLGDQLCLIDEVLTPDSSRFWPGDDYAPGRSQPSFDKQFLRDYLLSIKWNQQPPAPRLPESIIVETRARYIEALQRLSGGTREF